MKIKPQMEIQGVHSPLKFKPVRFGKVGSRVMRAFRANDQTAGCWCPTAFLPIPCCFP